MNDADLNARFEQIEDRFRCVDERFRYVEERFKNVEDLVKTEGAATRRHFDVVAEGLRDQIKVVAEGYVVLRTDVIDLKEGQQRLETGVGRLELRMLSLESRQTKVERTQKVVLTEVRLLADSSRIRRASRRT